MNTAGIKEYTCPNCKEPFTRLERGATSENSKVIGMFLIFLSLPGILFALFILLFADNPIGERIFGGGFLLFLPALFMWMGLRLIWPKRNGCPNCGIELSKRGGTYIAPGGIEGLRAPSAIEERLDMFITNAPEHPMGKMAKGIKSRTTRTNRTLPSPETNHQPVTSETYAGTGRYICPACGLPFTETVVKRITADRILGIILFIPGLFLIVLVIRIIPISGGFHDDPFGVLMAVVIGIIFTLGGAFVFRLGKGEACPNCRIRLEKVGDRYHIYKHPEVSTLGHGE